MEFKYIWYVRGCLAYPAMQGLIILLVLFTAFLGLIKQILKRKKLILDDAIRVLFLILIAGSLLHLNVDLLRHGGIYLLQEKESDAVEVRGYISAIREAKEAEGYKFPYFRGAPVVQCTINDIKCIAIEQGSLEVGDYVLVRYLPKSRYVLYIGKIDEESETTAS